MSLVGKIKTLTLRSKFILIISLLIVTSGISVSYYLISKQVDEAEQGLINKGSALIKVLAANCEYGTYIENEAILEDIIMATAQAHDITYVVVQNKSGEILAQKSRDDVEIPKGQALINSSDSLTIRKIDGKDDDSYSYELTYPVVTTHSIVSRENLGDIGKSRGHVVVEAIGIVRMGVSIANTLKEAEQQTKGAIIIILAVISATILISLGYISRVTKPIEQLAAASEKIAKGDLSLKVGIHRNDEIGQLATAFDSMVESIQQSRMEIEEYNRTLEEKIIERTRELEEAQPSTDSTFISPPCSLIIP